MADRLVFRPINLSSEKDISYAVNVLREELDENYSRELFNWKHVQNPFGKSYGFVAIDEDKIIGVRMLMCWDFSINGKIKRAVRPVDTATDRAYRGQGIFKKLTLECLENISGKYDFVFNTPNENSLPGNLKMGWQKNEYVSSFKLAIINPFSKTLKCSNISVKDIEIEEISTLNSSTKCATEFFRWRYKDEEYKAVKFTIPGHYLIYKKSKITGLPVLIIYEMLGNEEYISQMLNSLGKKLNVPLVYFYGKIMKSNGSLLKVIQRNRPVVVLKGADNLTVKNLKLSLGDLESKI